MRIVYLTAGAAGMYCGTCLHDNTLAAGLLELGQDVLLVPTYTPIRTDEADVSLRRLFYGGINVYLQQKSALFRHTPWFVDRILDWPALVDWLAQKSVSVDAAELGDLTVSMLEGELGRQRKELDKLIHWLATEARPDIIHLSNSMLIGMAREMGRRLAVPIVASLTGEDIFLERLPEPHYSAARSLLSERAAGINHYVALNDYYGDFMADYLGVARDRIRTIPHGLNLAGHGRDTEPPANGVLNIGYFARICHDKGLHLLVEAMPLLAADKRLPPWRIQAAGYLGAADRGYLAQLQSRVASFGLASRFSYVGEVDRPGKLRFLQSLHVMTVPSVYRESKGISILEAMANGVPVVVPAHGGLPEMIANTGGGILCAPENPRDLADKLSQLLLGASLRERFGRQGQAAIRERYHHRAMAQQHLDLYGWLHGKRASNVAPAVVAAN